jgi:hypothetical protein
LAVKLGVTVGDTTVPNNCPVFGHNRGEDEVQFNCSVLSKLSFPKFSGDNTRIWIDKYCDYFRIFNIYDCKCTSATSLHMEDNAAKWLQVYKLKVGLGDWDTFVRAVEENFGAYMAIERLCRICYL